MLDRMIDDLPTLLSVLERDEGHLHVSCATGSDLVTFPDVLVEKSLHQRKTSPLDHAFAVNEIFGESLELAVCNRFARDEGLVLLDDILQIRRRREATDQSPDRLLERGFKDVGRGGLFGNSSHDSDGGYSNRSS